MIYYFIDKRWISHVSVSKIVKSVKNDSKLRDVIYGQPPRKDKKII